jgi:4-amino-4-deoxy-L-arabinose transferase-like glycosyltransferase
MSTKSLIKTPKNTYTYAAALLLGLLFAQAMTSIPRLSITFDEDLHISTGYSVVATGDLRLVEDHPPLIGLWKSWPLLLSPQVPDPEDVPDWTPGDRRLFVRNEIWWRVPLDTWVLPARIPIAWLALVLGAFLFRWASDWFGPRGGLFALALLVFDPNILAHATLATLDLGVTCLIFATLYGLQRLLRRPARTNLVATGVLLGLALSAKISAAILLPVSSGLLILWGLRHWRKRQLAARLLVYLGVAFLALWAAHLFDFGTPQGLSFSVPAPTFWRSFLRVGKHVARGNRAYLLGETYEGGRWHYFPVAFALKTPLPALLLLGIACVFVWRRPRRWWRELILVSLPASYFFISVFNSINLGYRHILPILPFIYLFIARLATNTQYPISNTQYPIPKLLIPSLLTLLLLWQAVGTLRIWPHYLTFFNEIAGGPRNGYRYLADSNVDWGQGLKALRDYLEERDWTDVKLSSFTFFIRPELYGVQATPLPPLAAAEAVLPARFNPAPGTYVISASTLRGLQLVAPEMYNWFWHREPDDVVANAMLVYQIPEPEPRPAWVAQCTTPVVPLSPEAVNEGFGRTDLRQLTFDCTQGWLYPDAGESAGWYVLHREVLATKDAFMSQQLDRTRLSFEQKIPQTTPPLAIFEAATVGVFQEEQALWGAPVEWPPGQALAQGASLLTPVALDGPLAFLGYEVQREGRTITLLTHWRVTRQPQGPFSIMAHLANAEGRPVAVGDGLGVAWNQLLPGDVLVHRHTLLIPEELPAGSYWLQTGAYQPEPLARFPVLSGGNVVGDRLLLTELAMNP